jgi:hypothetical protein
LLVEEQHHLVILLPLHLNLWLTYRDAAVAVAAPRCRPTPSPRASA